MIAAILALAFVVDRIEPPFAVVQSIDHHTVVDWPLASLPPDLREGDRLTELTTEARVSRKAAGERDRRHRAWQPLEEEWNLRHGPRVANRSDHRQDHFFHRAKREGFAARSIYKLQEIDEKLKLLRRGARVLDLGCAPGSWMQYAAGRVGPSGRVFGIDQRLVTVHLPTNAQSIVGDIFEATHETLLNGGPAYDVVLSDMAPSTSGSRFTDHMRSMDLCHRVIEVAKTVLRPKGSLVCKAFEGEDIPRLAEVFRLNFESLKRVKPKGTRTESVELFFVGVGFRGQAQSQDAAEVAEVPSREVSAANRPPTDD
ncbi:MAG: methyltransferase domain-containing protein [Myxococcales bacterium]|nr:methyltransferase domain-containing protein [Myxococcales bacterium]